MRSIRVKAYALRSAEKNTYDPPQRYRYFQNSGSTPSDYKHREFSATLSREVPYYSHDGERFLPSAAEASDCRGIAELLVAVRDSDLLPPTQGAEFWILAISNIPRSGIVVAEVMAHTGDVEIVNGRSVTSSSTPVSIVRLPKVNVLELSIRAVNLWRSHSGGISHTALNARVATPCPVWLS